MDKKQRKKFLIVASVFLSFASVFAVVGLVFLGDKKVIGSAKEEVLLLKDQEANMEEEKALENTISPSSEISSVTSVDINKRVESLVEQVLQEEDFIESEGSLFTN